MCRSTAGSRPPADRPPRRSGRGDGVVAALSDGSSGRLGAAVPPRTGTGRGRARGRLAAAAVAAALALGLAAPGRADVAIERFTRSEGLGGLGAFESTSRQTTSAVAQRDETSFRFTGGFMSAIQRMAGLGDSVRITRLDRGLVWTLDPEKQTYTEAPLTLRTEQERRSPGSPRREPSDVVVTRSEFKVERTGTRKTINGFPCEEYLATWLLEMRNQKTDETTQSQMNLHAWTTPVTADIRAAQAQLGAYERAYLERIRADMPPDEARQLGLATMFASAGLGEEEQRRATAKAATELAKIQGYWIVTQVEWYGSGGGARAADGGGAPPRGDDLGSALGKLFGGGGGKPAPAASDGKRPVFDLYSEIRSLKLVSGEPARFEVPAGYTLKTK